MKVYLINLDRDKDRLEAADAQLRRLGVAYERVPAVYGKDLSPAERAAAVNRFRWWCAIGLPARDAEVGCALSHYGIYRRMTDVAVCILEDDAALTEGFKEAVSEIGSWIGNEVPRVVMLSDRLGQFADAAESSASRFQPSSFAYCTDAYVVNRKAAEALLRENYPLQRPCDHWARWVRRGAIELYHYLPTVARQDQDRFGTSTQGGLLWVKDYALPRWCWHKFCRAIGKSIDALLELTARPRVKR